MKGVRRSRSSDEIHVSTRAAFSRNIGVDAPHRRHDFDMGIDCPTAVKEGRRDSRRPDREDQGQEVWAVAPIVLDEMVGGSTADAPEDTANVWKGVDTPMSRPRVKESAREALQRVRLGFASEVRPSLPSDTLRAGGRMRAIRPANEA